MHHHRKLQLSEGTCRQHNEESASEHPINAGSENGTENEESSIAISDSDDVEPQEESILPKKRRRPPLHRKPLTVKRKLLHMTEEEQLALAVKISQQEQSKPEKYTQEEEEELIKKAIEESLQSCQVPDISISPTNNKTPSSRGQFEEEPCLPTISRLSDEGSAKSPVVVLQRLSQEIVESSSVILSPNCKDPVSCIESSLQSPLSTGGNFVQMSPAENIILSPVFPKKSHFSRGLIPCRLFQERSPNTSRVVDDLDDQCTHCSESSQLNSSSMLPTSCSQPESSYQNEWCSTENYHTDKTKMKDYDHAASVDGVGDSSCRSDTRNQSAGTVHYYWGVPFCPRGVDPSEYTKVILCQLEVYQKSLKSAQRQLLHKMDYGQPMHLATSSQENVKEDTEGNLSQENTEQDIAEDDTQKPQSEKERSDHSDSQEAQQVSSKRQKISESPPQTVLDIDHCSSSQDDKDDAKSLCTELLPSECAGVAPEAAAESDVFPSAARSDRPLMETAETAQEEEITICPETQPSPAKQEESDKEDPTDVIEIAPEQQASSSSGASDEDLICLSKSSKNVPCPMCQGNFPRTQIERHAAYCDGTNELQEMAVLRPRNQLRRNCNSPGVSITPDSGKCEKCYLCKSLVPLKNYQVHVDHCLQTAELETQGSQRFRSIKQEHPGRSCRLLSMLEQSESSLAERNGNAPETSNLSPPREEHDDHFSSDHLNPSDSPIRSFVSISEATDCLVDFKKQFSSQPSSRKARRWRKRRRM